MNTDLSANLRFLKWIGFLLALFGSAFSNSLCGIGLGTYFGAAALTPILDKKYEWQPYPGWRFLPPLLVSLAISVLISDHMHVSVKGLGKYLEGFLLLYAGVDLIRSESEKGVFARMLACVYAVAVTSGLFQQVLGFDPVRGYEVNPHMGEIKRLTGSFKHCNDYATFLVPGVVFLTAMAIGAMRQKKWAAAALWFVFLGALCFVLGKTLSRGAIVSAAIALLIFGFFFRFRLKMFAALALVLAALWFIPSPLGERLRELPRLTEGMAAGNTSERMILLQTSAKMIAQNPVFGLGVNTYSRNFSKFKPWDYPAQMYSHNSYVQMATEIGLLGVGLFLLFLGAVIVPTAKRLWKRPDSDSSKLIGSALLTGVFGVLINCLFDSVLQSTQLRTSFWSLLSAAAAIALL